jgi:hypothetical protein
MGKDDQPPVAQPPPQRAASSETTVDLPSDEDMIEPEKPAAGTPTERALAHVHSEKGTCSGVVLGPRVVVTASRCMTGAVADKVYVEIASSTLTWTKRAVAEVLVPDCGPEKLDLAVLVLKEGVDWVKPLRVVSAPPAGKKIQALGYGKCKGEARPFSQRTGEIISREDGELVIDVSLCHGDTGGPLVERGEADLLGIISHRTPAQQGVVVRLDTSPARALIVAGQQAAESKRPGAIKCE